MGGQACTVCTHPDSASIDEALVGNESQKQIADRFGIGDMALSRHKRAHLSPALIAVRTRREEQGAATALDRFEDLYRRASAILATAEQSGQGGLALQGIKECRALVELMAKLTGELDERPTVQILNVQTSQEWLDLRMRMFAALAPYPDARLAVANALELTA